MADTFTKARKGQLVAFARDHSYTSLKEGTHRYRKWHVGRVMSATRDGVIKTIEHGNGVIAKDRHVPAMVASSLDKRVAEAVAVALREESYDDVDQVRDAIKALLA